MVAQYSESYHRGLRLLFFLEPDVGTVFQPDEKRDDFPARDVGRADDLHDLSLHHFRTAGGHECGGNESGVGHGRHLPCQCPGDFCDGSHG